MFQCGKRKLKEKTDKRHCYKRKRQSNEIRKNGLAELEVDGHFSKRFSFKPKDDGIRWPLPEPEALFQPETEEKEPWESEMTKMKTELNEVKGRLNDKDIAKWREHTAANTFADSIKRAVDRRFRPELCTQAWCKFYEILSAYPEAIPEDVQHLNTVHLCEAPGAFVTSLNHFLKSNRPKVRWRWVANTLNPYYEGNDPSKALVNDRFILPSVQFWHFGQDDSGDIMNKNNLESLVRRAQQLGPISLVTADGSVDCQDDPGEQEALVAHLHYCEVVTALSVLAPRGCFVVKMFTFFESTAASLLYLLNSSFEQVDVFKPGTSKPGNSEVYVVCLLFKGKEILKPQLDALVERIDENWGADLHLICPSLIPPSFTNRLLECAAFFKEKQESVIDNNLLHLGFASECHDRQFKIVKTVAAERFVEMTGLTAIPKGDMILGDAILKKPTKCYEMKKGSFDQRNQNQKMDSERRIKYLEKCIKEEMEEMGDPGDEPGPLVVPLKTDKKEPFVLKACFGKPYPEMRSSPFASNALLSHYAELDKYYKNVSPGLGERRQKDLENVAAVLLKEFDWIKRTNVSVAPPDSHRNDLNDLKEKLTADRPADDSIERKTFLSGSSGREVGLLENANETSNNFLGSVVALFKVLENEDDALIFVHHLLSRLAVGVVRLLTLTFENVFLVSIPGVDLFPSVIVCSKSIGALSGKLVEELEWISESRPEANQCLLEIVSIDSLVGDELSYNSVTSFNNRHLVSNVYRMINRLKGRA